MSDFHVPYHDVALVDSALALLKKVKPHRVVLNGDINDFFQLSRFNVNKERMEELQEEIDEGVELRKRIRAVCPNAHLVENEGNHDSRIKTYVKLNAQALGSLRVLEPANLFHWSELEIDSFPGAGFRQRRNFLIKHGSYVRQDVPATAKVELQHAGISGVSGHTHRLGTYRKVGYDPKQWTEQGCLCRLDPDYVTGVPNWTHGMVIAQFSTRSDAFVVDEIQTIDGRFTWGGKTF